MPRNGRPVIETPLLAVLHREFLRRAYAMVKSGRPLRLKSAAEVVQEARQGIGLKALRGGRPSDLMQKLTGGYRLSDGVNATLFRKTADRTLEPVTRDWQRDWRKLFAPTHGAVRSVEHAAELIAPPSDDGCQFYRVASMDPVLPDVDAIASNRKEARNVLGRYQKRRCATEEFEQGVPGLYFHLDDDGKLYVGQTDEPSTRVGGPTKRLFSWHLFVARAPEEGGMSLDVLRAAEALAITFWKEVAEVANANDGCDKAPMNRFQLREAAAFVTVASAALLKFHRMGSSAPHNIAIPFRDGVGDSYAG